jgi:hypothetical protein
LIEYFRIKIPPLRERIKILLRWLIFVKQFSEKVNKNSLYRCQFLHKMETYHWPGNVGNWKCDWTFRYFNWLDFDQDVLLMRFNINKIIPIRRCQLWKWKSTKKKSIKQSKGIKQKPHAY